MADIPTFTEPEDAYFEFFRADSAKEPMGWANVMSYPHVRVSARGRAALYPTRQDYAATADWSGREATGWVRSKGIPPFACTSRRTKYTCSAAGPGSTRTTNPFSRTG